MFVHFNTAFENMDENDINTWIVINRKKLVGSAIFTREKSLISKVVQWAEKLNSKNYHFVPSHTGSIIEYDKQICVFDMKPLKATITPLKEFMLNTDAEYAIVLRDFKLDTNMFSKNIAEHIGEFYPFFSAISSAFHKIKTKYRTHCSELHLKELQKQGILTNMNVECTPLELYNEMTRWYN